MKDFALGAFDLNNQLANDCIVLGDFPVCRLLLMNDSQYPWFILVPRVAGAEELYQLDEEIQQQVLRESSFFAEVLSVLFGAEKMNVAAIGNMVRQLHIHHVVRYSHDIAWPAPVWGKFPAIPYSEEQRSEVLAKITEALSGDFPFQMAV
ncbi:HIT domain-containing protein [Endozoicomonas ascidiicola]|uniref:HIT domain-containing protein n=1 Tax=Endozoicomonas ascidiicola TaxID=1698521 RepID=UPI000A7BC93C|nr:HIT domain-containing protein [Endozoicomonas ascidiicola]